MRHLKPIFTAKKKEAFKSLCIYDVWCPCNKVHCFALKQDTVLFCIQLKFFLARLEVGIFGGCLAVVGWLGFAGFFFLLWLVDIIDVATERTHHL